MVEKTGRYLLLDEKKMSTFSVGNTTALPSGNETVDAVFFTKNTLIFAIDFGHS